MNERIMRLLALLTFFSVLAACGGGGGGGGGGAVSSSSSSSSPPPLSGTASALLTWEAPTTDENGDPLTDLDGYRVHYGTSPGNYTFTADISNTTSASISALAQGTWCFVVTAYDTSGNESSYSNEECITI